MILKSKIIETIDTLGDEVEIDYFMEKLLIIEKIERANKESLNGEVTNHEDFKKEVQTWFK
jgi:hypothetical protein